MGSWAVVPYLEATTRRLVPVQLAKADSSSTYRRIQAIVELTGEPVLSCEASKDLQIS